MRIGSGVVVVAVTMVAAAACSSASPRAATPGVATLQSAAAAPSASAGSQRPRERLDSTSEEIDAMMQPYYTCMAAHGAHVDKAKGDKEQGQSTSVIDAANKICEPQYMPLPPWEKDPANPEAKDFARKVVACLKGKGVKYVETTADGISIALGGPQNDSRSITLGMNDMSACEQQVAAAK